MALGQLAIFSCYFSRNVADALVELDLDALEEHIRKWKGPLILPGDFNAKARTWTGGPRDPTGDLLEEMMAAYNLVVTNQPGVHTYEKGIARSVLDLMFASPEVTKNISSWEVLDAVSLSEPIYINETPREAESTRKVQNERRMVPPKDEPQQIPTAN